MPGCPRLARQWPGSPATASASALPRRGAVSRRAPRSSTSLGGGSEADQQILLPRSTTLPPFISPPYQRRALVAIPPELGALPDTPHVAPGILSRQRPQPRHAASGGQHPVVDRQEQELRGACRRRCSSAYPAPGAAPSAGRPAVHPLLPRLFTIPQTGSPRELISAVWCASPHLHRGARALTGWAVSSPCGMIPGGDQRLGGRGGRQPASGSTPSQEVQTAHSSGSIPGTPWNSVLRRI